MTPHQAVIATLICAVIVAMLLSWALPRLSEIAARPVPLDFGEVREVALAASQLREFSLPEPALVYTRPAVLEIGGVPVSASRVVLVWACSGPVYEKDMGAWTLWANKTHCGLTSSVYVKDEAPVLTVYFFHARPGKVHRLAYEREELVFRAYLGNVTIVFDSQPVYSFSGYREVRVYRLSLRG